MKAHWHYTRDDIDFDLAPITCQLIHGEVPRYPINEEFQLWSMMQQGNECVLVRWYFEAIKIRLAHPGEPMDVIVPGATKKTKQWVEAMRRGKQ